MRVQGSGYYNCFTTASPLFHATVFVAVSQLYNLLAIFIKNKRRNKGRGFDFKHCLLLACCLIALTYCLPDLTIDSQQICNRFPIDSRRCSSRLPLLPLHHCFTRPYLSQFHHCYKLLATRLSAAPLLLSIYKNRLQLGSDLF